LIFDNQLRQLLTSAAGSNGGGKFNLWKPTKRTQRDSGFSVIFYWANPL